MVSCSDSRFPETSRTQLRIFWGPRGYLCTAFWVSVRLGPSEVLQMPSRKRRYPQIQGF